ncbi:DUF4157 domain-containing protein [Sinorhizobium meliloti]|uniref:eCIS core domain-containing protein n=1 Tax=Rhizobium meliloti TaxID=382 RepID=UPI00398D1F93
MLKPSIAIPHPSVLNVCLLLLSVSLSPTPVAACGGIFDVECNLKNGGLSPGNIGRQIDKGLQDSSNTVNKAMQDVGNALNELQASLLSGPTLEAAIIASRNTAINGAMPIPPHIRQQLTGYASDDSMNRVRYKVGDNGFANLAHLLEQGGFADAVTLIDVVVFRGPSEANDLSTWAHELTHIDQYAAWGVHSFAVQYARNYRGIEDPAYQKGNGYENWRRTQMVGNNTSGGIPNIVWPGTPGGPAVGAFCNVNGGRYGPGPVRPLGTFCQIMTPAGPMAGNIVR